ncbi:RNA polymerase II transcription factor B 52 kDa subunit [Onygenales sp. PD_40]|nr:RNA polymerase II transcription factor B 52 kDa subunit [Onygenales sp. PD_40]KAK2782491.1 RNA polymerase II transcription factor B 52 kDa subunit [Emmonsiellopsis sp. PD_33]KAK2786910.1 RNA polymerase II transcription factor B 52 kDa subunit [Onygenales sp. PD_10]KAK2794163.1 RNA polymerase II transcription factor B 52 kDa subunit [Onygenales sp. PD_12]
MAASSSRSMDYLEGLPGTVFRRLYQQPSTALAIFRRMLPHLAKCFVMALLYMKDPLPAADLELWVRPESKRERDNALLILTRLHILSNTTTSDHVRAYMVTDPFASSLRQALTGGDKQQSFGVPSVTPDDTPISVAQLDDYARRQWEGVLGYMVGTSVLGVQRETVTLSKGVKQLLQACHLVEVRDRRVEITKEGFAFVLQDVNTQVWHILILYVENAEQIGMDSVEVLSFLFVLSSLELGQSYEKRHLTDTQLKTLADLTDFGIVYQHSPASEATRFYPTRLATTLTSDSIALGSSVSNTLTAGTSGATSTDADTPQGPGTGFIIIETNYRLYAYTSSPLQISLIALFTTLKYRFPNLITGKLTRQSIRRAVEMGITADQIISYLTTHAHPQMRKYHAAKSASDAVAAVLPPTVVDQIRLWQLERDRIKATPGFLFKEFLNLAEFESTCRYAEEIGVLVWKSEKRRMFFVTRHEQIAAFLKGKKNGK